MGGTGAPSRKRLRLANYDYATSGAYFITICTDRRKCILGAIDVDVPPVGQGLCPCRLSPIGVIAHEEALNIPKRFPTCELNKHVVMPNHVHMLLTLHNEGDSQVAWQGQSPCPTMDTGVGGGVQDAGRRPARRGQSPCPTVGAATGDAMRSPCRVASTGVDDGTRGSCPTISTIIGAYKSITTKRANALRKTKGRTLWQPRFYDHVVRGEDDYSAIWRYIDENPAKWREDVYWANAER